MRMELYPQNHWTINFGAVARAWPKRTHGPLVEYENGDKCFGSTIFEAIWKHNNWQLKVPERIYVGGRHYRMWVDKMGRAISRRGPVIEVSNGDKYGRDELCGYDSPLEFILFLLVD